MIGNLKIRTKLLIMCIIPCFSILGLCLIGVKKITQTSDVLTKSYHDNVYKASSLLLNADRDLYQSFVAQQNLIKIGISPEQTVKNKKDFQDNIKQVKERTKSAEEIMLTQKEVIGEYKDDKSNKRTFEIFDDFDKNLNSWLSSFDISTGQIKDEKVFYEEFSITRENLNKLEDILDLYAADVSKENDTKISSTKIQYSVLSSISILIMLLLGILILKDSTKILSKIKELAERLSKYDFSSNINVVRKDEYGQTAEALNKAQENVRNLIKGIVIDSQEISASSEELSSTVEEMTSQIESISSSTKEINGGVQKTNNAAEEITASIEEVDSNVNILSTKASDGTSNSLKIKERATGIQKDSKNAIDNVRKVYTEKEKNIIRAIEAGKVVNDIVSLADSIGNISEQTNLLALNAAIEAAGAGEHGKGFAIVAEEVRKLAEQSAQAVNTVKETIQKVQEAFNNLSDNSSELLKFMNEDVNSQFESFVQVGTAYEKDADFVSSMSEELATMSQEISATISEVNTAVQNMAGISEKSAEMASDIEESLSEASRAMEEVSKSAQNQAELAQKLTEMVQKFNI